MAKLTIDVPDDLLGVAEREASIQEISLSKLVIDYFRSLPGTDGQYSSTFDQNLAHHTKNLVGCISGPNLEGYPSYLERKHS